MNEILIPMLIIGAIGGLLGLLLAFAAKIFAVQEDPRYAQVLQLLPGYNCGACGYPGCAGLANALVDQETNNVRLCKPSNQDQRDSIVEYLANTPGPDGDTLVVKG